MEFIENNYIWLIVIGVVVLMTIIGYFADKADKTEKVEKPKKEKKEKKQKKNHDLKEEIPEVEEPLANMDDSFVAEWDENAKPVEPVEDVINIEGTADTTDWNTLPEENVELADATENVVPLEKNNDTLNDKMDWDTEVENTDSVEQSEEPIFTNSTDAVAPVEPISEDTEISENVLEPSPEVTEVSDEQPEQIEEIPEQPDELTELEITLPNIETLNEEIKDVDDDEDVWKF